MPYKLIDDSKVVLSEIVSLNFSNSDSMYIRFSSKGGKKARAISPMSAIHSTHVLNVFIYLLYIYNIYIYS